MTGWITTGLVITIGLFVVGATVVVFIFGIVATDMTPVAVTVFSVMPTVGWLTFIPPTFEVSG